MNLEPDILIWHYFDLAKYIGLLSRGLFFALPSALRRVDAWEGCWGEHDFHESLDSTVHANPNGVAEWNAALSARHEKQDAYGVSCWHESSTESAALWQLYAPRGLGVAVTSTLVKLQAALGDRVVDAKRIDYRGHTAHKLGDDPLTLLSIKRPEFQHEREVRFFTTLTADEKTAVMGLYRDMEQDAEYRRIKPGKKGPLVLPGRAYSLHDSSCVHRGAPGGVHLPTNATLLIDRVHLAPGCSYPLRRAVIDVNQRFGLDGAIIKEAEFDVAPFDRVKFV